MQGLRGGRPAPTNTIRLVVAARAIAPLEFLSLRILSDYPGKAN